MRAVFVSLVLFTTLSCNDATTEPVAPARNRILTEAATFTPPSASVRVGGTIEFAFGGVAHNVIFEEVPGRPENIEALLANTVEERVFTAAGTYTYSCKGSDHGVMNGQIVVVPLAPADEV